MNRRNNVGYIIVVFMLLIAVIFTGYKALESNDYLPKLKVSSVLQENKVYNASGNVYNYSENNQKLINTYGASRVYNDKEIPGVKYKTDISLYVGQKYYPLSYISASHSKFGDISYLIQVIYDDVNTNIPGEYSTVYKVCNYDGSDYCRTVTMRVNVQSYYNAQANYNVQTVEYNKKPIWSNYSQTFCDYGDSNCYSYNVEKPIARDPYTNQNLNVILGSGEVNPYKAGTYSLVYKATTVYGVTSTIVKEVVVKDNYYNGAYNSNYYEPYYGNETYADKKYISNYYKSYYDDGVYAGYLTLDNNYSNNNAQKYISNYEWTNVVTYMYQCTNPGLSGTDGWKYIQTLTSDNHPTYYYNESGYSGTLNKVTFYCKDGCEDKLVSKLGYCTYAEQGQYKYITRTWVGVYSGYVSYNGYTNNNTNTYSGYVYRKTY